MENHWSLRLGHASITTHTGVVLANSAPVIKHADTIRRAIMRPRLLEGSLWLCEGPLAGGPLGTSRVLWVAPTLSRPRLWEMAALMAPFFPTHRFVTLTVSYTCHASRLRTAGNPHFTLFRLPLTVVRVRRGKSWRACTIPSPVRAVSQ